MSLVVRVRLNGPSIGDRTARGTRGDWVIMPTPVTGAAKLRETAAARLNAPEIRRLIFMGTFRVGEGTSSRAPQGSLEALKTRWNSVEGAFRRLFRSSS
ncbi:hypothetical protein [Sphaerisporangium fuscum]|uniref:hypothetical protein n=1 Tax=Sphaerisporangium fuscum TaxID=2835868 RepID=UPI001BDC2AAC|nr:hypothetical protein [Sphaerisporangium fuscum]